jgi:N-acetylneuraminate synthase/N,N'-diacetyllegionaminate synthase
MPSEEENATLVRRSWHAARNLPVGTVLTRDDLALLRPEAGISPAVDLGGRRVVRNVPAGAPVTYADLER